jgi:DNA-binding LacI/PurR family transcriptional regulator
MWSAMDVKGTGVVKNEEITPLHDEAGLAMPPLTTVRYDLREAGRHRAETVVASLSGHPRDLDVVPPVPQVVQRSSA